MWEFSNLFYWTLPLFKSNCIIARKILNGWKPSVSVCITYTTIMNWLIRLILNHINIWFPRSILFKSWSIRISQILSWQIIIIHLMSGSHKSSRFRWTMLQNSNEVLRAICRNTRQRFFVTLFLSTGNNLTFSKMRTKRARLKILSHRKK